jgi:hypothetical protein
MTHEAAHAALLRALLGADTRSNSSSGGGGSSGGGSSSITPVAVRRHAAEGLQRQLQAVLQRAVAAWRVVG